MAVKCHRPEVAAEKTVRLIPTGTWPHDFQRPSGGWGSLTPGGIFARSPHTRPDCGVHVGSAAEGDVPLTFPF